MRNPLFLGIDIGTSGAKGILVDVAGAVVASARADYDFDRPAPGWAETPPSRWWEACATVCRELAAGAGLADRIAAVGLSGQMHGLVLLDEHAVARAAHEPVDALRPAIMWNDQRTAAECAAIVRTLGSVSACIERCGSAPRTGFTLPKMLWVRGHEPEVWARARAVCLPKDFIALRLTGALATDVGDASGTMLLGVRSREWDAEMCGAFGIDAAMLPPAMESGTVMGRVSRCAAGATGLCEGTPVIIGSGDNQAAALGAGVARPGQLLAVLGTSGVIVAPTLAAHPDLDPVTPGRLHLFCDATGGGGGPPSWISTGCTLSAAGSIDWARSVLAPGASFDDLMREAAAAPAGSGGLVFLPYLTGERCPHDDPRARGGWIGLTRAHTRAHMLRAAVEGVCMTMAQIAAIMRGFGVASREARITGGAARSALWRQVLADCMGVPVVPLAIEEGPAYGAAMLAAAGVDGPAGGVRAIAERWASPATPTPPAAGAERYAAIRPIFDRLYHDTRAAVHALHDLASDA